MAKQCQQTYKICFCFRRRFKISAAQAPQEIKTLFDYYSDKGVMSVDHLHRFLIEVQKEDNTSRENAQEIIRSLSHIHRRGLHLEAFFKYLFSDMNPPLLSLGVHHAMTAPLSHYFIYTGHNSYLTGNQLSSDSSDIPIIKALERGVRVIELDIWPNSTKDDVDVLHGRTFTTPVKLIQCLESIKRHAFIASEYPVIITLEDHLTSDLQAKVAEMVSRTFGEILYCHQGSDYLREFPSPDHLKRKIIISTKPPKEYLEVKETKEKASEEVRKSKRSGDEAAWGKEVPKFNTEPLVENKSHTYEEYHEHDQDHHQNEDQHIAPPDYKSLIAIHAPRKIKGGGLSETFKIYPDKAIRLSLSEEQFEKATLTHAKQIIRFTWKNLLRIYPRSIRVDSSNYNPMIGWMHGAQMVAFNMQAYGRSMWLMQGMFRANGGCGYVKKPDFLLNCDQNNEIFDPKNTLKTRKTLKVTVYMGEGWFYDFRHTHFDTFSPPDFYARVGVAGVPADTTMKRTKTLEDKWIPAWNETFVFPLSVPELALLRIEVHEYDMTEKDDFGGQTCLPVWELRQGIRSVPLYCQKGDKYKSVKLLMNFEFI